MEIGSKIKQMRLKLNLTQEELADRCELSKGFISQLENDVTSPSIVTLEDIVNALGSSLREFFADGTPEKVVFEKDDYFQKQTDGSLLTWLVTNSQKNEMEPILVELQPNAQTEEDMPHEGEEFGFVISGSVTLVVGKNQYTCKKGDSFYFVSDKMHFVKNQSGATNAKFLWVSSPPNF